MAGGDSAALLRRPRRKYRRSPGFPRVVALRAEGDLPLPRPDQRTVNDADNPITGGPSTPYDAGIRLAHTLGGSMLTPEGEQHGILASGESPCQRHRRGLPHQRPDPPADARFTL